MFFIINSKVLSNFASDEKFLPTLETWHFGCSEVEKIFAEFKEDLIKVGKILLNNVGGKNVSLKRWTTNVDEQKCSLKGLI